MLDFPAKISFYEIIHKNCNYQFFFIKAKNFSELKKILSEKKFGVKKILIEKNFGMKKIFLVEKKFQLKKIFWSKKNLA